MGYGCSLRAAKDNPVALTESESGGQRLRGECTQYAIISPPLLREWRK
jgi:hypothetical protein